MHKPFALFTQWYNQAEKAAQFEPYGVLSTIKQDLSPAARVVLFKIIEAENFTFCTNRQSNKSKEIFINNKVAICFYWENIAKQIRIEGTAEEISRSTAIKLFKERPREHQLASIASKQSKTLINRELLSSAYKNVEQEFINKEVPTPDWWTGFSIKPYLYEFWDRGAFRLHHRTLYLKDQIGAWDNTLLYP